MEEYHINSYISVKLEGNTTILYVNGKQFNTCKALVLQVEPTSMSECNSIDEIIEEIENVRRKNKETPEKIPPLVEFWGHCSNLQAWADHNYDTCLLHSNLSFPLLKELAKAGDPQARAVFCDEIVKRFNSGHPSVVQYLIEEGFLEHIVETERTPLLIRLLHSKPSIHHLKKIAKAGSLPTRAVISDEIVRRFNSEPPSIVQDLIKENLLEHVVETERLPIIHRLLHSDLSLSLLRSLVKAGDPQARAIFSDKIVQRFNRGNPSVVRNLVEDNYLEHVVRTERLSLLIQLIGKQKKWFKKLLKDYFHDLSQDDITIFLSKTDLGSIHQLDLTGLELTTLPEIICHLKALQKLFLRENHLTSLPEAIGSLIHLNTLNLFANQLENLPDTIKSLTSLQELSLSHNQFKVIPPLLGDFPSLRLLFLANNNIIELPPALAKLTSLELLDLSSNQMAVLPDWVGNLQKLHTLLLAENKFALLPGSISNLTNLQTLVLQGNALIQLPEDLGNLVALRILNLHGNQLEMLPESVSKLRLLEELDISNNKMTGLLGVLGMLINLKRIDMRHNKIASLPEAILNLPRLTKLDCWDNPFDQATHDILRQLKKKGVDVRD